MKLTPEPHPSKTWQYQTQNPAKNTDIIMLRVTLQTSDHDKLETLKYCTISLI